VLVNGALGALITVGDQPFAVLVFTAAGDRIVAIDGLRDPQRVRQFADAAGFSPPPVTSPGREGS
jgi:hypothetical protein